MLKSKRLLSMVLALFLLAFMNIQGPPIYAEQKPTPEPTTYTGKTPEKKQDTEDAATKNLTKAQKKIGTDLLQLLHDDMIPSGQTKANLAKEMQKNGQLSTDKANNQISDMKAYVYIQLKPNTNLNVLNKYVKIKNQDPKNGLVTAWVNVSTMETLAALDSIQSIRTVQKPVVNTGSVNSQGDAVLRANLARTQAGVNGSGVKVGIISDGVDHLSSAVTSGDLPLDVTVLSNSVGGDEGTAMLEIVNDLAPGAKLYFHDCGDNTIAFNQAIDALVSAGCTIICDDISWIGEPFFEDGTVASHVKSLVDANQVLYLSSAGNAASSHYQGQFYDDGSGYEDFSNGTDDTYKDLYVNIPAGGSVYVILEWNEPFGSASSDYNMYLVNVNNGSGLAASIDDQSVTGDPIEGIYYYNSGTQEINAAIQVNAHAAPTPKTLEAYVYCSGGAGTYTNNIVAADSIMGQPAVPGVIACGAVRASTPDTIEYFSSQGPVTMLSETRQKPDICGTDGVSVSENIDFPSPSSNTFYGTSASAPHVAAVAALVKSKYQTMTASELRQSLINSSVDLGSSGFDSVYGYGRIDALLAFFKLSVPNLSASTVSSSGITVSWSSVPGASGYDLYRATSSNGTYTKIKTLAGTSFSDSGLTSNRTYYYKVRAYMSGTTTTYGNYSTVASTMTGLTAPTLTASAASYNSVKLTWSTVSGANGYSVYRATSSAGPFNRITSVTGTTYTDSNLISGTTYYYKVRAYTSVNGDYSSVKSATPVLATPTLSAASAGYNSIKLTWSAVPGARGYDVFRATSSAGSYQRIKSVTGTTYTDPNLVTGTTYYYKVRGYTSVNGSFSAVKSAKPVLAAPTLAASTAAYNSIRLSWSAVPGASGYEIQRATSSGGPYTVIKSTTGTAYTDAGLTTGRAYYYAVRAYRTGTTTSKSAFSYASVAPVPATPKPVTAARASSTSIKVTWGAVSGATKYEVYRATSSGGTYTLAASTSSTTFTNTGLTTGQTYYYKVRAYHLEGSKKVYGNYSSIVYAKP